MSQFRRHFRCSHADHQRPTVHGFRLSKAPRRNCNSEPKDASRRPLTGAGLAPGVADTDVEAAAVEVAENTGPHGHARQVSAVMILVVNGNTHEQIHSRHSCFELHAGHVDTQGVSPQRQSWPPKALMAGAECPCHERMVGSVVEQQGARVPTVPDQFLQDGSNKRADAYGGSIENRSRFLLELVEAMASGWGSDRVAVRIGPSGTWNGMSDSNPQVLFSYVAAQLNQFGLAYLHIIEPRVKGNVLIGEGPAPGCLSNCGYFKVKSLRRLRTG